MSLATQLRQLRSRLIQFHKNTWPLELLFLLIAIFTPESLQQFRSGIVAITVLFGVMPILVIWKNIIIEDAEGPDSRHI